MKIEKYMWYSRIPQETHEQRRERDKAYVSYN